MTTKLWYFSSNVFGNRNPKLHYNLMRSLSVAVYALKPRTGEAETGRSHWVEDQSYLHSEFQTIKTAFWNPTSKEKKKKKNSWESHHMCICHSRKHETHGDRVCCGHNAHWRVSCYHCILRVLPVCPWVALVSTSTLFSELYCLKHRLTVRKSLRSLEYDWGGTQWQGSYN